MVCKTIVIQEVKPTLAIEDINVVRSSSYDNVANNEYGVTLAVYVAGTGKGNLKLQWGNVATGHTETKTGVVAGKYTYIKKMEHGTHQICADLFSVVL